MPRDKPNRLPKYEMAIIQAVCTLWRKTNQAAQSALDNQPEPQPNEQSLVSDLEDAYVY